MSGEVNVNGPTKLIPIALGLAALVVGFFLAPPTRTQSPGATTLQHCPKVILRARTFDPAGSQAFAFSAGTGHGNFWFEIDGVRLE